MPADDALSAAIEELYSLDPERFAERRSALASRARRDGDANTARAISGLRRPTKAAWIINRLVRAEPGIASGLAELGTQLREAQRCLDGARLRQLTQQRRKMIDAATRQALAEQVAPSASLRHEVTSTLEAGLADPEVAEQLSAGTLVRSAEWSGFGDPAPTLSVVPTSTSARRPATTSTPASRAEATKARSGASPATTQGATAAQARAERQQQRQASELAAAEDALAKATEALQSAAAAEQEQEKQVGLLMEQLADTRRRLEDARLRARQARARQRVAQRSVDLARRRST